MEPAWIEVLVTTTVDPAELLGRLADEGPAGSWQDDGVVRLYWAADRWQDVMVAHIREAVCSLDGSRGTPELTVQRIPDQDWNAAWARSVTPIRVGRRLVIRPSWEPGCLKPDDLELVIDPKQAFGTGRHATTRLLLEWLEEQVHGGERVLDVGAGSGILAMAALRLGAGTALGLDHDPIAIDCAGEYAALNGFGRELTLRVGTMTDLPGRRFDLVLANLDRRTILELIRPLLGALNPGGRLLLSGVLIEDRAAVESALAAAGGTIDGIREFEPWVAMAVSSEIVRRGTDA